MTEDVRNLIRFETIRRGDVALVGGKNSSPGEMVQTLGERGIRVPDGFSTTSDAFRKRLKGNVVEAEDR